MENIPALFKNFDDQREVLIKQLKKDNSRELASYAGNARFETAEEAERVTNRLLELFEVWKAERNNKDLFLSARCVSTDKKAYIVCFTLVRED